MGAIIKNLKIMVELQGWQIMQPEQDKQKSSELDISAWNFLIHLAQKHDFRYGYGLFGNLGKRW